MHRKPNSTCNRLGGGGGGGVRVCVCVCVWTGEGGRGEGAAFRSRKGTHLVCVAEAFYVRRLVRCGNKLFHVRQTLFAAREVVGVS